MRISSSLLADTSDHLLIDGYFALLYILKICQQVVHSLVLIDCSASGYRFIDHFYVHKHNIPIILLNISRILEAFDEKPTKYG